VRTMAVDALRMVGARTAQGRLVEYLAYEWSRMETPFDRIVLMAPRPVELPSLGSNTEVQLEVFGGRLPFVVWEQVALPRRARSASLLFCPTYIGPLRARPPVVVANHGIYERTPDEFTKLQRLRSTTLHRLSARRADRVIANSRNTRMDVAEFFRLDEEAIDVVYPAANQTFFAPMSPETIAEAARRVLGSSDPYFIFVGKLSRRRHVPELIEAFARLRTQDAPSHRLLVVGPDTTGTDVAAVARANRVADEVVYLPHLDQQTLAALYAGADAFVLPTTYEGISYTMFEAMASGTAVLTVDHPTLAEGAGDTALAVASPSADDLYHGLRRLVTDRAYRDELARRGRDRAATFSWERNARETVEILDRIALPLDREAA
jgi:glycosyltransferase involved in cell wall biosynthesis